MTASNLSHLKNSKENNIYFYEGADSSLLEFFDNKHPENDYMVYIEAPEFTSLCPITGQPDFATIKIWYKPDKRCVESKSLKLYLGSFRMHGEFHEDCVNRILNDLVNLLNPKWIKVKGEFTPRGGIKFWPEVEWSKE